MLSMLSMLAERAVPLPARRDMLAYCPTMDLLALATDEERVYVYRLNGQRVLGLGNKKAGLQIRRLQWKPDGKQHAGCCQS